MILPNDFLLIKVLEEENKSASGIIVSMEKLPPCKGEVITIGTKVEDERLRPGVFILFEPDHLRPFDKEALILERNILAILDESIISKVCLK